MKTFFKILVFALVVCAAVVMLDRVGIIDVGKYIGKSQGAEGEINYKESPVYGVWGDTDTSDWKGKVDRELAGIYVGEMNAGTEIIDSALPREYSRYFDDSDIMLTVILTLEEDGVCYIEFDKKSVYDSINKVWRDKKSEIAVQMLKDSGLTQEEIAQMYGAFALNGGYDSVADMLPDNLVEFDRSSVSEDDIVELNWGVKEKRILLKRNGSKNPGVKGFFDDNGDIIIDYPGEKDGTVIPLRMVRNDSYERSDVGWDLDVAHY